MPVDFSGIWDLFTAKAEGSLCGSSLQLGVHNIGSLHNSHYIINYTFYNIYILCTLQFHTLQPQWSEQGTHDIWMACRTSPSASNNPGNVDTAGYGKITRYKEFTLHAMVSVHKCIIKLALLIFDNTAKFSTRQ